MALEFFDETLHLGLVTARDAAFIPKGALTRATNARYRPGDFAVFPAEGRVKCGPVDSENHSIKPIDQIVGIQWDEGTEVAPGVEGEYHQILYITSQVLPPFGVGKSLKTVVASDDPQSVDLDEANARSYNIGNINVGSKPLHAVEFDNEWFLFSGGRGLVLSRIKDTGMTGTRHGMPVNNIRIRCEDITTTNVFTAGSWWYWFVWVNTAGRVPIEGTADGWEVPNPLPPGEISSWHGVEITAGGGPTDNNLESVNLYVRNAEWMEQRPFWADRIYIYRGQTSGVGPGGVQVFNAWPIGYRILDVSVAQLESIDPVDLDGDGVFWLLLGNDDFTYDVVSQASQPAFPATTVRIDSEQFPLGKNGEPPRCSVATVFNESMVCNDEDDKGKTRFSFPQEPHAFPDLFFINHRTGEFDEVVGYVGLGRVLGVYLTNGVERINFLPSNTDFNFREGRLADQVLEQYGATSSEAIAKFTHPSGRVMIAHVARNGIWVSDLFPEGTFEVTRNLNWRALVGDPNNLSSARLENDPDEDRLVMFYNPNGGTPDRMLFLHYDITHLGEDQSFAITGPIMRPGGSVGSTLITLTSGTKRLVSTDSVGRLLYETLGWADESDAGGVTPMDVMTREVYVAGITQQMDNEVLGVHTQPSGASGNTTVRLITTPQEVEKEKLIGPLRELVLLNLGGKAEAARVQIVGDMITGLAGVGINVVTYSWNPMGHANRRSSDVGT
jgi:hypothetical protein